ncbi:MAG: hypothetical protein ACLS48_09950 [[Eubacterium] siraeum]
MRPLNRPLTTAVMQEQNGTERTYCRADSGKQRIPGWIVLSTAGAAVLVGGIIAGSVISNRKSKDDKR